MGHRMRGGLVRLGHWVSNGEEDGDVVVRQEGTTPIEVGRYGDCRIAVVGDCVDAGAHVPLETGICFNGDWVQVHHVPKVEGPQERPIARVVKARSPFVSWPSRRIGVSHH